ncbi:hypothetical protein [Dactylosporangium salmoneum]|uniref:hypothetical protein n=1 Tax=Dactylosporangium salmoneum TaxID=53361 RepID=UPI0031D2ECF3
MAIAGTLLISSPARADDPGDGCYYDIRPVGHLTYIMGRRQLYGSAGTDDTITTETIGWLQQEYSSSCHHMAAHLHLYGGNQGSWYAPWTATVYNWHNTPSGSFLFSTGQWSPGLTSATDIYSWGEDIHDSRYHAFSVHADFQTDHRGKMSCSVSTDTHDYNTGGNTASGYARNYCTGAVNQY